MLHSAMGEQIVSTLKDPLVTEVMINPDGRLRLDRLGQGRSETDHYLSKMEVERIIRLVASHAGLEVHEGSPIISAELPYGDDGTGGERFEGLLPPLVTAPCFSIRKPAYRLYSLKDYVEAGIMTIAEARILSDAVLAKKNILIAGGTGSGKTTLVNALLAEVAALDERIVLIEDTRELKCSARDCITLKTKTGLITMKDLVRSTLRLRPDRIMIGEVRGPEALDLLKAWNTGHPGGIATLHANSAYGALIRLEQLIQEAVIQVPRALIAEAIDLIVFIKGEDVSTGQARRLEDIVTVSGLDLDGRYHLTPAIPILP